jgi:hypothetical protein
MMGRRRVAGNGRCKEPIAAKLPLVAGRCFCNTSSSASSKSSFVMLFYPLERETHKPRRARPSCVSAILTPFIFNVVQISIFVNNNKNRKGWTRSMRNCALCCRGHGTSVRKMLGPGHSVPTSFSVKAYRVVKQADRMIASCLGKQRPIGRLLFFFSRIWLLEDL